jgi:putative redox protein
MVRWTTALASDGAGHIVVLDASKEYGGEDLDFRPFQLMLLALAGCTAMDVVSLMRAQHQRLQGLKVYVKGSRRDEEPRYLVRAELKYVFEGEGLDRRAIERAIRLSQEKYCSVGATLKGRAEIQTSYEIVENGAKDSNS